MASLTRLLGIVCVGTLLVGALVPNPTAARGVAEEAPPAAVVIRHSLDGLIAVDPTTGAERWRLENRDGIAGTVAADGFIYFSVAGPTVVAPRSTACPSPSASRS